MWRATIRCDVKRAISSVKVPLWPSVESSYPKKLKVLWSPRIGEAGAGEVVRSNVIARRFLFLGLTWLVLVIFFQVVHSAIAVAITCLLWLPILYLAYLGIRATSRIQGAAGAHLGLTRYEYRAMPVRDTETFDRWIASRGDPGWPRRFRRP